jgi:hypothetical protein
MPRLLPLYHIEHVRSIDINISFAVNDEHIIDIIVSGSVDHLLDDDDEDDNEGAIASATVAEEGDAIIRSLQTANLQHTFQGFNNITNIKSNC